MTVTEHHSSKPSLSIVVPLYQYPITPQTWQPLFEVISKCPSTEFIVIINPNSGPGLDPDGWQPDKRYSRGILKLQAFTNVTMVGYVRLDYCRRPIEDVEKDIRKYAAWGRFRGVAANTELLNSSGDMSMHGIFFDEVPNLFKEEIAEQLASYSKLVRQKEWFGNDCWIIHNPGTIPDVEYLAYWTKMSSIPEHSDEESSSSGTQTPGDASDSVPEAFKQALECVTNPRQSHKGGEPDLVVIFEGPYEDWQKREVQDRIEKLSGGSRTRCCHIVHSAPREKMEQLLNETSTRGSHLYVTDLVEKFYESFGMSWMEFCQLVEDENLIQAN